MDESLEANDFLPLPVMADAISDFASTVFPTNSWSPRAFGFSEVDVRFASTIAAVK